MRFASTCEGVGSDGAFSGPSPFSGGFALDFDSRRRFGRRWPVSCGSGVDSSSADSNSDFDQIRLGGGFGPGMGPNSEGLYGRVEYINWDFGHGNDDDGIGGAIGYGLPLNPQLRLHGEIGYAYLDDIDGPELTVGATYRMAQNLGLFADYRAGFYDTDGGPDVDIGDLRFGVRFTF